METWKSRPKRRNWKGWIVAIAFIVLLGAMCALSFNVQLAMGAGKPPTLDKTEKVWPPAEPNYTYVCKYRPEAVSAWKCAEFRSRKPYR